MRLFHYLDFRLHFSECNMDKYGGKKYYTMDLKKLKFYLVDDSNEFLIAMKLYLEQELGVKIIGVAKDGSEALNDPEIFSADFILMDIIMKNIDGIRATNQLSQHGIESKIIAITNSREYYNKQDLIKIGFKGCISKNLVFKELNIALDDIIKGKHYFSSNIVIS
ncbi:response regulator transcription factor [Labilibacter sediminis]|nr:response regulator transcription factor [Labilibacter sediminis]